MTYLHNPRARATLALVSALFAIIVAGLAPQSVRAAEPNGYGELTRFGVTGSLGEAGKLAEVGTRAIGVDSNEENSVFVLDEYQASTETERFLRLQKFVASSSTHEYGLSTAVEFTEKAPASLNSEKNLPLIPQVEGLAVDPTAGRVYLLGVGARETKLTVDRSPSAETPLTVASTLYSFSTATLAGAGKEGPKNEVLANEAALETQSTAKGKALLEPRGITVDPAKHEVIVLGHIDEKGEKEDSLSGGGDRYALQRIEPSGKLGERYVDSTNFFKKARTFKPHSPVVVSTTNARAEVVEHVDVGHVSEGFEDISEVPYEFKSTAAPTTLSVEPETGIAQGVFGSNAGSGGRIAAGPEGALYGIASIRNEAANAGLAGVEAISASDGSELGWSGGQQPDATDACVIENPSDAGLLPQALSTTVAAGAGGKIFVLAPEFLLRQEEVLIEERYNPVTEEEEEIFGFEPIEGPFFPAIVELGPGGTGCPQASVTPPVARVNGIEVTGEEPIRPGSEVTLSSHVKQADALEVEWNFGDGSTQTVKTDQFQTTSVKHKYDLKGKHTVTETVRLDNLSDPTQPEWAGHIVSPTVTKTQTINVNTPIPVASLTGPASVAIGQTATFDGSTSSDPEHLAIKKYAWAFGDGATLVTTTPSTTHSYATAGTYTVSLTVTDEHENVSNPTTRSIRVEAAAGPTPTPTPTPPPPTPPGGGSPGTGSGSGAGSGSGSGSGSVLAYHVGVSSTSLTATAAGAIALKVSCSGQSSCTGTVTLRSASAISSGAGHKKAIVTLATGSFSAGGGSVKSLTLHLSAKARALLARLHVLRSRATIVARDSQGASHSTVVVLTLRAPKHKH